MKARYLYLWTDFLIIDLPLAFVMICIVLKRYSPPVNSIVAIEVASNYNNVVMLKIYKV